MNRKKIYNLEFPSYCEKLNIGGHVFKRVKDYEKQVKSLQHLTTVLSEYSISANTGSHNITAFVELPIKEKKAVFPWDKNNATALNDILVLLSIFTGRDVFLDEPLDKPSAIIADPRKYQWGGSLRCSIPYKETKKDQDLGYNIGFEEGLNKIYSLIRTDQWLKKYQDGYFLLLLKHAEKRQILETAFVLHWTILEHLFTLHNRKWLSDEQIRKLPSAEKISFLLVEYALSSEITKPNKKRISELAGVRNRLVHFGKFLDARAEKNAELVIRLTEFIVAKILGLLPSNVFNTIERLEQFFNSSSK
ncbi:hypothetical protein CH333_00120 [candidate division WOR-3 bacterium JGI_Cruoil_03_44_89]|uniref:Apea-like HEPN domain-containing protein n=1 Tax=candidate division WOR-3 bacterium JGI_Cruoil_03_44_89 TaxID=1973748 RepID=A0A235BZI2_UNCW3|nr:MAG: hypothetical protein CH333_00120 [candidate division WOR-3 bacterium JGI_Cruoil_03_44_89]